MQIYCKFSIPSPICGDVWTNWSDSLTKKNFQVLYHSLAFWRLSAELLRKSCLSLRTRFLSKCVWLNVAGILVMHLPLWITRKSKTGGWKGHRLGHSRSHLTVIRGSLSLAPAPHSHLFLHHKVSLSAGTESDFIAANSWQRRNKPRKMDLILEFSFIFGLPLHAPLRTALEKQTVISESRTICHMRRGCSRWKSGRLHLKC